MIDLRKTIIASLSALTLVFPATTAAQDSVSRSVSVERSVSFRPHLFLQPQAGVGFTMGEVSARHLISPAAAINLGYSFTPAFSLRAGLSGWQARAGWVAPVRYYKFDYLQGNVDAMLSFTSLLCGWNPSRVLDVYGFAGLGLACGFHNNEAADLYAMGFQFEKLWTGKKLFPAGRLGLGLDINLSNSFALNIEANVNMLPDRFNSRRGSALDWQYNALVGVKYTFGGRARTTETRIETEEVVETVPVEPQHKPVPLTQPAPAPVEAVKPAPMTQDIFFRINSSVISQAEQAKVDALVSYLKENPESTVTITGYADKATGYPAYNMKLSLARAAKIADALKAAGIHDSRIIVDAKGDTVQPFDTPQRNRVAIAITH
ncbi:MAG: OmpA family protein [Odoribacter sp.]|nr:OmpA family protein [Odoribacter sp.]